MTNKFIVRKDSSGRYRWIASHTNSFVDLDEEIITAAAHKEFDNALGAGYPMPTLIIAHEDLWTIGVADFFTVDEVSDGVVFVISSGVFNDGMDDVAKALSGVDCTMSHGLLVLKTGEFKGKRTIDMYRSVEVSVLPAGVASPANPLTYYYVAEETMGIKNGSKRDRLIGLFGEKTVTDIEAANAGIASKAIEEDIVFKEAEGSVEDDTEAVDEAQADAAAGAEDEAVDEAQADAAAGNEANYVTHDDLREFSDLLGGLLKEMTETFASAVAAQNDVLKAMNDQVSAVSEQVKKSNDEIAQIKKQGDTPAAAHPAYSALIAAMNGNSEFKTGDKSAPAKEDKSAGTRPDSGMGAIGYIHAIMEAN